MPVCFPSGVFENAFANPVVWLTALLSTWMAVLPSATVRALSVILRVHDKHKVRQAKVELSVCRPLSKKTRLVWMLVCNNVWTQQGSFCLSLSVFFS